MEFNTSDEAVEIADMLALTSVDGMRTGTATGGGITGIAMGTDAYNIAADGMVAGRVLFEVFTLVPGCVGGSGDGCTSANGSRPGELGADADASLLFLDPTHASNAAHQAAAISAVGAMNSATGCSRKTSCHRVGLLGNRRTCAISES